MRQRRWLVQQEEKFRKEHEELKEQRRISRPKRPFDQTSFLGWYDKVLVKYNEAEQSREELKRCEDRERNTETMAECKFVPQVIKHCSSVPTRRSRAGSPARGTSNKAGERHLAGNDPNQGQAFAEELAAAQASHLRFLRQLDEREQKQRTNALNAVAECLRRALEDNKRKVELFIETEQGLRMISDRAGEYVKLDISMTETNAVAKAHEDLLKASEAQLRAHVEEASTDWLDTDAKTMQLERLQVVRDLIQLQRRYTSLFHDREVSKTLLSGFDTSLLEKLRNETWYCKARASATQIMESEAEIAAQATAARHCLALLRSSACNSL